MKKLTLLLATVVLSYFNGFSQTDQYNLASEHLHKKVRKTIEHNYTYDKNSGGFVKKSVSIKNFNNDGNLIETFYKYNSVYSESTPIKKKYIYNKKKQLLKTEDISDTKGKYSSHYEYIYDKKGRLLKRKNISKDGSESFINYTYDRKGRVIKRDNYSNPTKLSSETEVNYKGNKRTEVQTSYSSKDGSIYGVYTTVYKNDVKISYASESKYGNSTTTYTYDKYGNLLRSNHKGKTSFTSTYTYEYDKKGNWIKKHYVSGKYHYFYFREIISKGNKITGNTDFDRNFINIHGNFDNVAVVPLKKKTIKKKNNNNTTVVNNNYNSNMPAFRYKDWSYSHVKMSDKVTEVSGKISISVEDENRLKKGASLEIKIDIDGGKTRTGKYKVIEYKDSKLGHIWVFKHKTNGKLSTFSIFKEKKTLKGKTLSAMFIVGKDEGKIIFYLQ